MRILALLFWLTTIHSADLTWMRDPGRDIIMECNHGTDLQVTATNGKLEITLRENHRVVDEVAKKFDGDLHIRLGSLDVIGVDKGEFGGGLGFVKDEHLKLVISENVQGFITIDKHVYALTGLSHLGSHTGKIWHCREENGELKVWPITMLPGTPSAWIVHQNDLLVLTSTALVSLSAGLEGMFDEMTVLNNEGFWGPLYPNGMVQIGDEFYVGARNSVLRFSIPKSGGRTVIELGRVK